jgi:multiple sugar transport system ATP-binding protein
MDEPLSNLDAKLRVQMRAEIARLQRELAVTTVYVTHDQVEAMTMGDRVAVLKDGFLQQVDTPQNLYDRPDNVFVGAFIGSPSMNLFEAGLSGSTLKLGSQSIVLPDEIFAARPALRSFESKKLIIGIRPEDFEDASLMPETTDDQCLTATVALVEALGSELVVHFGLDATTVDSGDPDAVDEVTDASSNTVGRFDPRSRARARDQVKMVVNTGNLHFFDPAGYTSIWS